MTKSEQAQAIIVGSFILYMIDSLLDRPQHSKGSVIRLKQMLRAKTSQAQNRDYVVISNEAWASVVEKYKDKNYRLVIFDAVESLGFDNQEIMTKMFGSKFLDAVGYFSLKQTFDGVEKAVLKESREITAALKKAVQKSVYDNKEKL